MQFKEETVPFSAIDTDDSFYRITTDTATADLSRSIEMVGLLNPPFLSRQPYGYRIVSGFRRINSCQRLGWSKVKAKVLAPIQPVVDCIHLAVADNTFQRPLNLIEISRCVGLIRSVIADDRLLLNTAIQLGLPNNLSFLKKVEGLHHLSEPIQEGILCESISLAMALNLAQLKEDDAVGFAEIFNTLKLSLNKQREILTLVQEIAARENMPIRELLTEKEIKDLILGDPIDRAENTRILRQYLKRRRFPEITRAETGFAKCVKNLKLGSSIKLVPPKHFEGSHYTLQLDFEDLNDLKDHKSTLDKLILNQDLATILKK